MKAGNPAPAYCVDWTELASRSRSRESSPYLAPDLVKRDFGQGHRNVARFSGITTLAHRSGLGPPEHRKDRRAARDHTPAKRQIVMSHFVAPLLMGGGLA